jgi:hypothetical protein
LPYHEFGVIENLEENNDYSDYYCPEKYDCIKINDELILLLINQLSIMKTYYHNMNRPDFGLAYYGVTLIPPESLTYLEEMLLNSKHQDNSELNKLIQLVRTAILRNKYIIHYGI